MATRNTFTTGAIMNDTSVVVVDVVPPSKQSILSGTTNQAGYHDYIRYGSEILGSNPLIYLADPSISGKTDHAIHALDDQTVITLAIVGVYQHLLEGEQSIAWGISIKLLD